MPKLKLRRLPVVRGSVSFVKSGELNCENSSILYRNYLHSEKLLPNLLTIFEIPKGRPALNSHRNVSACGEGHDSNLAVRLTPSAL